MARRTIVPEAHELAPHPFSVLGDVPLQAPR
jgi:hypothetical protein